MESMEVVIIDALLGWEFLPEFVAHCHSAWQRAYGKPINVYENFES